MNQIITPKVIKWSDRINAEWNKSRDGFFGAGQALLDAKVDCSHGEWLVLVDISLPFGKRTAQALMAIAGNPMLTNTHNYALLPNSWNACHDLGRLSEDEFQTAVDAGVVQPDAPYSKIKAYLAKEKRQQKHADIQDAATPEESTALGDTYPLIYADPPWTFETFSEGGKVQSPERHYPTLSFGEIEAFQIGGVPVQDIAHKDAALFLWCTSSNLPWALDVMKTWGFTYKTNAVWDKQRTGMGYLFLNQHEHLLMGTRGNMPAPVKIFPSVFSYPRRQHSQKPDEVRGILEQMYPHFTKNTRLEMFCRRPSTEWTVTGYESQ